MMPIHIEEFLYRGRPEGSDQPPAWHVVLASTGIDDFGQPVWSERVMTMAQATEAGWDLPKIIDAINADLMADSEAKRGAIGELTMQLEEMTVRRDQADAAVAVAQEKLVRIVAAAETAISEAQSKAEASEEALREALAAAPSTDAAPAA